MTCPDHDERHVCDRCPEQYDTDGFGFAHRFELKGRTALRHCIRCGVPKTRAEWSDEWAWCKACTLGTVLAS